MLSAGSFRGSYYRVPVIPLAALFTNLSTSFSLILSYRIIGVINILLVLIIFIFIFNKYSLSNKYIIFIFSYLIISNPRLQFWQTIPHIYILSMGLLFIHYYDKLKFKLEDILFLFLISFSSILIHFNFVIFTFYVAASMLAKVRIGQDLNNTSPIGYKIKIIIINVILIFALTYYLVSGVLVYLIREFITVNYYKRAILTLVSGYVPFYSYILPLILYFIIIDKNKIKNYIFDLFLLAFVSLGILLSISGKSNYGRHVLSSGYIILFYRYIPIIFKKFIEYKKYISMTLFSLLVLTAVVDVNHSIDWNPTKYEHLPFSFPTYKEYKFSLIIANLFTNDTSVLRDSVIPIPKMEPTMKYSLFLYNFEFNNIIDEYIIKKMRDVRDPCIIHDYEHTQYLYITDYNYCTPNKSSDLIFRSNYNIYINY